MLFMYKYIHFSDSYISEKVDSDQNAQQYKNDKL